MSVFNKILCPTDFSEASYEALNKAIELATAGKSEICVLHIEPAAGEIKLLAGHAPDAHSEADRRAETVKNLCAVLEERVPQNVSSKPIFKQGAAGQEIIRAAREEGADLIVLTTHGAGGLAPGDLGRVASHVVQLAPCPVLTINRSNELTEAPASSGTLPRPEYEVAHSSPSAIFLDGD